MFCWFVYSRGTTMCFFPPCFFPLALIAVHPCWGKIAQYIFMKYPLPSVHVGVWSDMYVWAECCKRSVCVCVGWAWGTIMDWHYHLFFYSFSFCVSLCLLCLSAHLRVPFYATTSVSPLFLFAWRLSSYPLSPLCLFIHSICLSLSLGCVRLIWFAACVDGSCWVYLSVCLFDRVGVVCGVTHTHAHTHTQCETPFYGDWQWMFCRWRGGGTGGAPCSVFGLWWSTDWLAETGPGY